MSRRERALSEAATRVVDEGVAPAAVVGAARVDGGWIEASGAAGRLWPDSVGPGAPPVSTTTVFDLASLTKPLTALTLARLERRGILGREEPLRAVLGQRLPEIAQTASADVPLDSLMAHRAGLVAHNPFYEALVRGERPDVDAVLVAAAHLRRPECTGPVPPDGFPAVYSDLGYLLVGAALEARTGEPLDALIEREVVRHLMLPGEEALGSARQLRARGVGIDRIAPTEVVPWRGGLVRGIVHDENAWLVAGEGTAGHAGMFGSCRAVLALGRWVLDALGGRSDGLTRAELAPLIDARPSGSHAAGFDRRSEEPGTVPSSGRHFRPGTFGHLGFTGTSLWIDPAQDLVGVLLTNRVCPSREHIAIRAARPVVYDAIAEAMVGGAMPPV